MIRTPINNVTYFFILAHATKLIIFRQSRFITTDLGGGFKAIMNLLAASSEVSPEIISHSSQATGNYTLRDYK